MKAGPARDIVVVGSINMDLVMCAPRLPLPGEALAGTDFAIVPGGKGGNQAVAAARLGACVAVIGCIGADPSRRGTQPSIPYLHELVHIGTAQGENVRENEGFPDDSPV
jgi:hypothetical protein